jgi:hypothetical protein
MTTHEKGRRIGRLLPFRQVWLLAEMPPPVLATEQGTGDADEPVEARIVVAADRRREGGCSNGGCGGYGAADHAGCDVARPEAAVVFIAVVAVAPAAVVPIAVILPVLLLVMGLALVVTAVAIRIARSLVLAIGVWIELRAIAGIGDDFLRHGGGGEPGCDQCGGAQNSKFCHFGSPRKV